MLVTDPVKDTMPQQRDKRKVARLRVVRGNPKEVERAAMVVQQARVSEVIDAESKVVHESVLALLGTEADSRKTEQTLGGVYGGRRVSRPLEKVEKTKHERRCHWEVGTEGWEPRQGQTLHSIHGETIEHDLAEKIVSTSPSTTSTLSVLRGSSISPHKDNWSRRTMRAVRYGESPQKTVVFAGALMPSASVPVQVSIRDVQFDML